MAGAKPHNFFETIVHPAIDRHAAQHPNGLFNPAVYAEMYLRLWWGLTRILGYLVPLILWRLFFPRDRLADFGLRVRGLRDHAWIYALCVVVMVPVVLFVSRQRDFIDYYPMYKQAGRSWLDFGVWEVVYLAQFFTLEIFFRGFWLRAMRGFGAGAIWSMIVPYCMIHFGKPFPETLGVRDGVLEVGVHGPGVARRAVGAAHGDRDQAAGRSQLSSGRREMARSGAMREATKVGQTRTP